MRIKQTTNKSMLDESRFLGRIKVKIQELEAVFGVAQTHTKKHGSEFMVIINGTFFY